MGYIYKITNNIKLFFIDLKLFAMPIHTRKSADFAIAHLRTRTLELSLKSNKQQ